MQQAPRLRPAVLSHTKVPYTHHTTAVADSPPYDGFSHNVEACVWLLAGGHGVPTNHTLAHEHYLNAHDAGHWQAPHSLAMTHQLGWGVQPNCSKAQHYIQTFIKERSPWSDQMDEALLALDAGLPLTCFGLLPDR